MFSYVISIIREKLPHQEIQGNAGMYLGVYEVIRNLIESGELENKLLMPPSRVLAERLGLSRSTLVKAYSLLIQNQYLESRQGSGTRVSWQPPPGKIKEDKQLRYPELSSFGKSFLENAGINHTEPSPMLGFTPGLPPVDVFPIGRWQKLTNEYWRTIQSSDLSYSISSGLDSLKRSLCKYLRLSRRIHCEPDQIVVVSGSLQSLFLLGSVLIEKGDKVVLENPTFPNVAKIFKSLRADILPVEADAHGMNLQKLNQHTGNGVKLIHCTPSSHYPLGGKMSLENRLSLISWAKENASFIIENDYEHEINNWQNQTESIFSLDSSSRTVFLGTFNRILHPSIRLGYMVLPPALIPAVKALQMQSHRFVPQSLQVVMTGFIEQNYIFQHVRKVVEVAAERRSVFDEIFSKAVKSKGFSIRPHAHAGFHLILDIPEEIKDDRELVADLHQKSIATHSLSQCYFNSESPQGLIIGFSCLGKGIMQQTIQRMASVLNAFPRG